MRGAMDRSQVAYGVLGVVIGIALGWYVFGGGKDAGTVVERMEEEIDPGLAPSGTETIDLLQDRIKELEAENEDLALRMAEEPTPEGPSEVEARALEWLRRLAPDRFGALTLERTRTMWSLDLSRLDVDRDDLALLAAFPNLAELNLRGLAIRDGDLVHLKGLTQLERLDLTASLVTNEGLKELTGLGSLKALALDRAPITDAGLETLGTITTLRELSLDGTPIGDDGLDHLCELPLDVLRIGATDVTDGGLMKLDAFELRELSLYRLLGMTDEGMRYVGQQRGLESLMIRGANVTEAGFRHIKELKNLRTLNASLVMDDAGMVHLKELTGLERLMIYSNPGITDDGMRHVRDLENVTALSLQFTKIGDDTVKMITNFPNLRVVDLRGTEATPEAIDDFQAARPDVKVHR